jgi:hypothetical protein
MKHEEVAQEYDLPIRDTWKTMYRYNYLVHQNVHSLGALAETYGSDSPAY